MKTKGPHEEEVFLGPASRQLVTQDRLERKQYADKLASGILDTEVSFFFFFATTYIQLQARLSPKTGIGMGPEERVERWRVATGFGIHTVFNHGVEGPNFGLD